MSLPTEAACRYCNVRIHTPLVGRVFATGSLILHERRCAKASDEERAHYRRMGKWPPRLPRKRRPAVPPVADPGPRPSRPRMPVFRERFA